MASSSRSLLLLRRAHRAYATISTNTIADAAQASSAATKIKERREQTVTDFAQTPEEKRSLTREEKRLLVRPHVSRFSDRNRLRGFRVVRRADGSVGEQVVGQRIYLPNIVFTLVRNHTPAGQPYNPYEATFYIPQNITKTDVRSYLHAVYGVECTYIRTDNYLVPMKHLKRLDIGIVRDLGQKKAYKRAIVGLKQPFYYPQMVEDMNGKDRWLRQTSLDETFQTKDQKELQAALTVKFDSRAGMRGNSVSGLAQKWDTRKKILRKLWERREEREQAARDISKQLEETRK